MTDVPTPVRYKPKPHVETIGGRALKPSTLMMGHGYDPWLLAMCASIAASWGFMMPSGTGPNAIAWSTQHVALPRMLKAGLWIDLFGIPLIVGAVWAVASFR